MILKDYVIFEEYIAKVFKEAGYSVSRGVTVVVGERYKREIDVLAEKDSKKYCVEVKYSQVREEAVAKVRNVAEEHGMTPVLVSAQVIEENKRKRLEKMYPNVFLIDIANLIFAVQSREDLYNELIASLSYVVDEIEPKEGFLKVESLQHSDYIGNLIGEMNLCQSGNSMARTYEVLCCEILKQIFSESLTLWKEQQKSNKGLYRFDLLCRIKDGNQRNFWSILEKFFNSKYIVFEFKNYGEPITQSEIYTTEKYLYAKALRSVAIIVTQNGYDENAAWAAKGCLRENGKLIILLNTDDLIHMSEMKIKQEEPSDYLLEKLDNILLELEK